jgi:plastocyanin
MPVSPWRPLVAVLAMFALLAAAAACGTDDDVTEVETPLEETVTATRQIGTGEEAVTVVDIPVAIRGNAYGVTEVHAPAGTITLRMINSQSTLHNIAIREPVELEGTPAGQGEISSITADFPPGEYEYFSTLGDAERLDDMTGTLIVR